jgi:hypothetical protein
MPYVGFPTGLDGVVAEYSGEFERPTLHRPVPSLVYWTTSGRGRVRDRRRVSRQGLSPRSISGRLMTRAPGETAGAAPVRPP